MHWADSTGGAAGYTMGALESERGNVWSRVYEQAAVGTMGSWRRKKIKGIRQRLGSPALPVCRLCNNKEYKSIGESCTSR